MKSVHYIFYALPVSCCLELSCFYPLAGENGSLVTSEKGLYRLHTYDTLIQLGANSISLQLDFKLTGEIDVTLLTSDAGNSEESGSLYGLGLRVGLYLHSFRFFLYLLTHRPGNGGVKLAASVMAAVLTTCVVQLIVLNAISPAEVLILLLESVIAIPARAYSADGNTDGKGFAYFTIFILVLIQHGFSLWFYLLGHKQHPTLGTFEVAWVFAEVRIDGWYRILGLVLTVTAALIGLFMLYSLSVMMKQAYKTYWGITAIGDADSETNSTIKRFLPRFNELLILT